MRNDIFERTLDVVRAVTTERRRYKELEEETGIPATNWQSAFKRKQRPTAHMIEALCRRWPQYAFWLATGLTDPENGHTAPDAAWTSSQDKASEELEQTAVQYFELKTLVQDVYYGPSGAHHSYFKVKQNPSAAELEEAREINEAFGLISLQSDVEPVVLTKKYSDLDQAIAKIAFDRRRAYLENRFNKIVPIDEHMTEALMLIENLQIKRSAAALKASKKRRDTTSPNQMKPKAL
jgi:8-oxo-dGTP pyrophosphatase MutT (NUDIX family)